MEEVLKCLESEISKGINLQLQYISWFEDVNSTWETQTCLRILRIGRYLHGPYEAIKTEFQTVLAIGWNKLGALGHRLVSTSPQTSPRCLHFTYHFLFFLSTKLGICIHRSQWYPFKHPSSPLTRSQPKPVKSWNVQLYQPTTHRPGFHPAPRREVTTALWNLWTSHVDLFGGNFQRQWRRKGQIWAHWITRIHDDHDKR